MKREQRNFFSAVLLSLILLLALAAPALSEAAERVAHRRTHASWMMRDS